MITRLKQICVIAILLSVLTARTQTEPGSVIKINKAKKNKFRPGFVLGGGGNYLLPNGGDFDDGNFFFKPSLTFQTSNRLFLLGGMLGPENSHGAGQWGVEFMYQYYPNGSDKLFNLYFFLDPAVIFYHRTHNYPGYSYYGYNSYSYRSSLSLLKMGAGYGFRMNIAKSCYFYEHNEIGVARGKNSTTYSYPGYHPYTTIGGYGFLQLSFGLGFVF